jgi:(1->4)-alpha-D-glucan 1-alpha-D-glucosylmutase
LATLRGYWEMDDISAKVRLGVIDPQEEQFARDRRAWDKQVLLEALRQENLLPPEADSDGANDVSWSPALVQAVHLYLARSPSLLLAVQLDDLVGELHQANLPDSGDNANWRHRSNLSLEQLQRDITVSRILTEIARQRA